MVLLPCFGNLNYCFLSNKVHKLVSLLQICVQLLMLGVYYRTLVKMDLLSYLCACLQTLLPRGCCRVIYNSDKYEDSWRCNFLGLTPGVALPQHADLYVSVDVIEPEVASKQEGAAPTDANFVGYTFSVTSPTDLPEKGNFNSQPRDYFFLI